MHDLLAESYVNKPFTSHLMQSRSVSHSMHPILHYKEKKYFIVSHPLLIIPLMLLYEGHLFRRLVRKVNLRLSSQVLE